MNCLVCNTTHNLLPKQLDFQIWTSLFIIFEDCLGVTIPEECANDKALTFCHECILNLELWRCNRDQEIECSGRAKQVKARMAAKILSLPNNSEKDLVLDDKKKIAHQSVVVDQIRGQVRKRKFLECNIKRELVGIFQVVMVKF